MQRLVSLDKSPKSHVEQGNLAEEIGNLDGLFTAISTSQKLAHVKKACRVEYDDGRYSFYDGTCTS